MTQVLLLEREFVVGTSLEAAWEHLERVEDWPSWARHIRRVDVRPPGALRPTSEGELVLAGGMRSVFRMAELDPGKSWKWVGPFLADRALRPPLRARRSRPNPDSLRRRG